MQIEVSGRHLDITPAIREYATSKAQRLTKHYDRIHEISVIAHKHDSGHEAEIVVKVDHHDPVVSHHASDDLYACIDQAVHKAERQLTDLKEKIRNRKHPPRTASA